MNNPNHPNANYPAASVHTILLSLASSLDAVIRRPEDTPYQAAFGIVGEFLHENPALTNLNDQEKKAYDKLVKKFVYEWKSMAPPDVINFW